MIEALNISREGNYRDEARKTRTGENILHFKEPLQELSLKLGVTQEKFADVWGKARLKLFNAREERVHPFKDDKVLTNWNGLMIAALAKGSQMFDSAKLSKAAESAVDFILDKLKKADGRLMHQYREGEATVDGNLDDYAFLIWGLIELYEATFDTRYLKEALRLQDHVIDHFWDKDSHGFFFKSDDSEKLLVRHKEFRDGATPSSNSVAFSNLVRLSRMTGKIGYEEKASALARAASSYDEGTPSHNTMFLTALDFLIGPTYEITIVGSLHSKETENMLQAIRSTFIPNKVMLLKEKNLENLAGFTKDMKMIDSKTTAYICRDFVCSEPTTEIEDIMQMLSKASIS
jgi:uncharacterized protein YyaL (SSP411 family)